MPINYAALARQHGGVAVEDADDGPEPLIPGNIDLGNRPRVRNSDGSISTVRSIGVNFDGREYLIPTVSDDGRVLSNDEAVKLFQRTGKHLGAFKSAAASTAYAKSLHDDQAMMVAADGMRPMVAHAPRGQAIDYAALAKQHGGVLAEDEDAGTLNEEPRTPAIGEDPRLAPDAVFNDAQTQDIAGATAVGLMTMGAPAVGGTAGRVLASPVTTGVYAGGKTLYETGDPVKAVGVGLGVYGGQKLAGKVLGFAVSKALKARLQHQVAQAATSAEPALSAKVVPIAKEAAADIDALILKATDPAATSQARIAARSALQKAGWTPDMGMAATPILEEAAPVAVAEAAPSARKATSLPTKGNVKLPTIYTKPPTQGPKPLSEADAALRAKQLEAAQSAGVDLSEAFGGAVRPAAQAEQAAESALETRLRASVLTRRDKAALADEIAQEVVKLREAGGKAATAAKISKAIEEKYGLPPTNVSQMVQMVLREHAR